MPDSYTGCQVTRRSWRAEPSHSEELSSPLPPCPGFPASGQPRSPASSTPPTLLHPSLTAGRSRLTRRRAASLSCRPLPGRVAPLQRTCQRGSERPAGWGWLSRVVSIVRPGEWSGNARAHMHTHPPSHTRNRLGQGREEEGDVASHGVTLTSRIPGTLWRGR